MCYCWGLCGPSKEEIAEEKRLAEWRKQSFRDIRDFDMHYRKGMLCRSRFAHHPLPIENQVAPFGTECDEEIYFMLLHDRD
jgi:hypothetical protein